MIRIKTIILIFSVCSLFACQEEKEPVQKRTVFNDIKRYPVVEEDTLDAFNLSVIRKIESNNDSKDSSLYLVLKAGDITVKSLGEEAWIINMWYGGSYEDIFVYTKSKTGSYNKIAALSGVISFNVLAKTDHGLKRFKIKNNRNSENVIFRYNGTDYSEYFYNGSKKSLSDSSGINTLNRIEIYQSHHK